MLVRYVRGNQRFLITAGEWNRNLDEHEEAAELSLQGQKKTTLSDDLIQRAEDGYFCPATFLWLAKLFYPLLHKFAHSYYVASGLVCGP